MHCSCMFASHRVRILDKYPYILLDWPDSKSLHKYLCGRNSQFIGSGDENPENDLWLDRLEYKLGYYAFMNWCDDYTMPYGNPYTT